MLSCAVFRVGGLICSFVMLLFGGAKEQNNQRRAGEKGLALHLH